MSVAPERVHMRDPEASVGGGRGITSSTLLALLFCWPCCLMAGREDGHRHRLALSAFEGCYHCILRVRYPAASGNVVVVTPERIAQLYDEDDAPTRA